MKNILIINGHPDKESFNSQLAETYRSAASKSGAKIEQINISELNFNPNLSFGYRKRTELEPDLIKSQEKILWADHLVWVYPVWWGSFPAIMKGFIDRVFLPGFAFQKEEKSILWKKLLINKTARVISTMDQPSWFYRFFYKQPSHNSLKKTILEFCGISPVKITSFGPVKNSTEKQKTEWLKKTEKLGYNNL